MTCPTVRIHPAIIAQASATAAAMMPGRFFLGVGPGENLNEHILGQGWPETEVCHAARRGDPGHPALVGGREPEPPRGHYTVENARLYTLPDRPSPLLVAVGGPESARLAGRAMA